MIQKTNSYKFSYFQKRKDLSFSSAERVISELQNIFHFETVVDLGCGTGTWLKACKNFGCKEIVGYDEFADESLLTIPVQKFVRQSLSEKIFFQQKFDLAICLEVAEHVNIEFADLVVENLISGSDVILFSAAIPGQGGTHHVNEQPPSFWLRRFSERKYVPIDCLRTLIWEDEKVAWWYKQNIFLFVNENALEKLKFQNERTSFEKKHVIHPECLRSKINELDIENASLKNLAKAFLKRIKRKIFHQRKD